MKKLIVDLLSEHVSLEKDKIQNLLEIPPDSKLGDYSFPCFVLAKELKNNPIGIATDLAVKISDNMPKGISGVKAINGYLNFFVDKNLLVSSILSKILKDADKFGKGINKNKEKIMVEFSQANTHKAFHVGHIRGTSLGESISRILEFSGNKVVRANYQGDTGMHVAKWIWCFKKYHSKEALKKDEAWIASIYVDAVKRLSENADLQAEVDVINKKLEEKKDKDLVKLWQKTRKLSLDSFEKIYKQLNTHFDVYFFEKDMEERGKEIAKELVQEGIARISEGAVIVDLEQYKLGVWVLLRKDGTVLYSAKDLALAEKKFQEAKIDKSIGIIGAAQSLHTSQLLKTLELRDFPHAHDYSFVHFSEVRLPEGKMSSRTGQNILYSDFIKEVVEHSKSEIKKRFSKIKEKELEKRALAISISAIKYSMLKQDSNKILVFDKEEALNFEGNTGPYLQYSYARANSIMAKSRAKVQSKIKIISLNEKEILLAKKLAEFQEAVEHSNRQLNPSLIANYSFQLCQAFNEFYNECQVILTPEEEQRIALTKAFMIVQKSALNLLGIDVLEEM